MTGRRRRLDRIRRSFAALAIAACVSCTGAEPRSPNVLLILADDLGYGDLGTYGRADAGTPEMDRLAGEGARFTRHYAHASCAPARAALLTGRYPERAGFRPRGRGLPAEVTTLAELLQERGYTTQHVGKWHMGGTGIWGLDASPASGLPSAHGFDRWFGFLDSRLLSGPQDIGSERPTAREYRAGSYLQPWLMGSEAPSAAYPGHLTDLLTDRAVEFIRTPRDTPWFLNLWYLAPHSPLQPHPRFGARTPNTAAGRRRALVQQLDESVGRVLRELEETGQANDTLVLLLSDNGGSTRDDPGSNAPLQGRKTELNEGGLRTPLLVRYPVRVEPGRVLDAPVSILDLFPTIAGFVGATARDVDGRDLAPLLAGRSLPDRPLFWEQSLPDGAVYFSVLSGDGRFRLSRGLGDTQLLDLVADPNGGTDTLAAQPDVATRLQERFRRWRREVVRIPVERSGIDARGRAFVTGSDLLRAPGWGGFTFGVGVTPDAREALPKLEEVIAYQRGLWELTRSPRNALRLRLGALELKGKKLRDGACNAVVVTGHFTVSPYYPELTRATLALFVDGEEQASAQDVPPPVTADLSAPTLLGLRATNRDALRGALGAPVFLSTRVVATGDGLERSASDLTNELCPGAEG